MMRDRLFRVCAIYCTTPQTPWPRVHRRASMKIRTAKNAPVSSAAESAQFKTAHNGIGIFQQDAGNRIVVQIDASNPRVSGYITADRKGARRRRGDVSSQEKRCRSLSVPLGLDGNE